VSVFVAFTNPLLQPAMRQVLAITNANPASVTTAQPHLYISGTIVRFYIPDNYQGQSYGMPEINQCFAEITVTSPTTFTVPINSINYIPFAVPGTPTQYAMCVPIGENNNTLRAAELNKYDKYIYGL